MENKTCLNCIHHYNVDGSTCRCRLQPSYKNTHFTGYSCSSWSEEQTSEEAVDETLEKGHGESCAGKRAPDTTDWVTLKHQYVGMAILGLLAAGKNDIVDFAINIAEDAIEKLKKKEENV